jgi:predicted aminopeptidase
MNADQNYHGPGARRLTAKSTWQLICVHLCASVVPLLFAVALFLSACSEAAYYWQAANGQIAIIHRRRPIAEVLDDPAVSDAVKAKLRWVLTVQDFAARDLAEPREGNYKTYADLQRPYVSWLVVAAPELRMEEHTWCYWIAGCLGYRGFFAKADADALAKELAAQGLDVAIRPVRAYSTLGWFDDPVLNTFLSQEEVDLAATIIHEQAHRRLWVKGDTTFNESFAGFVEQEGLRRFAESRRASGGEALWQRYLALEADRGRFMALVLAARKRLLEIYAGPLTAEEQRARKQAALADLRVDYQKQRAAFTLIDYESWFAQPLNNAHLVGVAQYETRREAFRALFAAQGGDFEKFFVAVEALGKLPRQERERRLDQLEAEGGKADYGPAGG